MGANFDAHTQPALLNGPYCSFRGAFAQLSSKKGKKKSTWNYFWVNIFSLPSFSPPFCSSLTLFFVSNLFPNSGLREVSQGQCVEAPGHVAASSVCISSALLRRIFKWLFLSTLPLFPIFQIALVPTRHSWPPANLKPSLQLRPRAFTVSS